MSANPDGNPGLRDAAARFVLELSFREIYLSGQWRDAEFGEALDTFAVSAACPECCLNLYTAGGQPTSRPP
jgi:hypothetical protein